MKYGSVIAVASLFLSFFLVSTRVSFAASTFFGITRHVSTKNLKVYNPSSYQTLSFEILPKFRNVYSEDGKATYQMALVHARQYVRVDYDQHLLGVRRANRITILTALDR